MVDRLLQSALTGGEISPRLLARADAQRYYQAAARLENWIPQAEGGVETRAGGVWIGDPPDLSAPARLIPFVKSVGDTVAILVQRNKLRFWNGQTRAPILNGGSPYEITCPWGDADLAHLAWRQSADVIYVFDRRGAPVQALARLAATNWTLTELELRDGPWGPDVQGIAVTPSGVSGAITLTASAAVFSAAHVGALVRLRQSAGASPYNRWEAGKAVIVGDLRVNAGRVYQALNAATTGNNSPIHDRDAQSDGAVNWQFVHDGAGVARITAFTSATVVSAAVVSTLPSALATSYWQFGLFNGVNGHPKAAAIYQERYSLAGSDFAPDTLALGRTGGYGPNYADFKPGLGSGLVVDSDGVTRTLANGRVEPVRHMVAVDRLYVFTSGGVHLVGGPSADEPITPSAASARRRPGPGAGLVEPLDIGTALLYVARGGRALHEVGRDTIETPNLAMAADHIGRRQIVELAHQASPASVIWLRLADGSLASVTFEPGEQVVAFARHPLGGAGRVECLVGMPRGDDRDDVWMMVRRRINGADRLSIEAIGPVYDEALTPLEQACCVDAAGYLDLWNATAATWRGVLINDLDRRAAVEGPAATFTSADIGRTLALRLKHPNVGLIPDEDSAILRIQVDTLVSATRVEGRIMSDGPPALWGVWTTLWARMTTVISGLGRLEGQALSGLADGAPMSGFTVTAAQATLPEPVARGWFGLGYTAELVDMPVASGLAQTALGAKMRVMSCTLIAARTTIGTEVVSADGVIAYPVQLRRVDDPQAFIAPGFVGFADVLPPDGWGQAGQVRIRHAQPTPAGILGIIKEVALR
jgi:hypothetical protein